MYFHCDSRTWFAIPWIAAYDELIARNARQEEDGCSQYRRDLKIGSVICMEVIDKYRKIHMFKHLNLYLQVISKNIFQFQDSAESSVKEWTLGNVTMSQRTGGITQPKVLSFTEINYLLIDTHGSADMKRSLGYHPFHLYLDRSNFTHHCAYDT